MFSYNNFQGYAIKHSQKIKSCLFLLALFCLVSPFSGFLELHSNLIIYFNSNFASINKFPTNINPIFLILEFFMYELNLLLSFLFPNMWGPANYQFLRFLFKLPLFVAFILIAFLTEKIVSKELNNNELASKTFYFQLFIIPLIYTTFILGTSESITIFFILLQFNILLSDKNQVNQNDISLINVFIAGFLLGIAVSFSYLVIFLVFLSIFRMKFWKIFLYVLSLFFSLFLINLPVFILGTYQINYSPDQFGIVNLLVYYKLENIAIYILAVEVILLVVLGLIKFSNIFDKLMVLSFLIIFLTVNLSIIDFMIFLQLFILGLLKELGFDYKLKIESKLKENLPIISFYFLLIIIYVCCITFLFINYQITDVIYLKVITLSPIGIFNKSFLTSNNLNEFKMVFYIIFSFFLSLTSLIMLKKGKTFNVNKKITIGT